MSNIFARSPDSDTTKVSSVSSAVMSQPVEIVDLERSNAVSLDEEEPPAYDEEVEPPAHDDEVRCLPGPHLARFRLVVQNAWSVRRRPEKKAGRDISIRPPKPHRRLQNCAGT